MPGIPHIEPHFTATDMLRDIVIGMSDCLMVPFAQAAGISGAVSATNVVVTAGVSEIAAGSIAMGLGGYLAACTDYEHYATERQREWDKTETGPEFGFAKGSITGLNPLKSSMQTILVGGLAATVAFDSPALLVNN